MFGGSRGRVLEKKPVTWEAQPQAIFFRRMMKNTLVMKLLARTSWGVKR